MKLFRKRYVALIVILGMFVTCRMEFLKFRKSEEKQASFLKENGVSDYRFGEITVGDRKVHYTHVGADTLPVVLFVHGSPGSSADALGYLVNPGLRAFQRISIDRPGFGYSDFGRVEPSLKKQAECVAELLRRYPARPAVLVGHSYGGPVIARVAMDYPGLVDGIVIVAGALDPDLEPDYWWQKPLDWPLVRSLLPPAFRVSNQEIIPLKEELEAMQDRWSEINCAVTLVQGLEDGLVHPDNYLFAEKYIVNAEKLRIDTLGNAGHFILWTREARIVGHILEMIEGFAENKKAGR